MEQIKEIMEIMIPISFFAAIVLSVYFVLRARTKERLALIEKGIDINLLIPKRTSTPLKNGLLFTGIGFGLLLGLLISMLFDVDKQKMVFVLPSMALFFGGLGLITFYVIDSKKVKE